MTILQIKWGFYLSNGQWEFVSKNSLTKNGGFENFCLFFGIFVIIVKCLNLWDQPPLLISVCSCLGKADVWLNGWDAGDQGVEAGSEPANKSNCLQASDGHGLPLWWGEELFHCVLHHDALADQHDALSLPGRVRRLHGNSACRLSVSSKMYRVNRWARLTIDSRHNDCCDITGCLPQNRSFFIYSIYFYIQ